MPSTTLERFRKEHDLEGLESWKAVADLVRSGQAADLRAEGYAEAHKRLVEAHSLSCQDRAQLARDLGASHLKVGELTMALERANESEAEMKEPSDPFQAGIASDDTPGS